MSWIEDPGIDIFKDFDLRKLGIDEAYVNITSNNRELWLYSLSDDCFKCSFSRYGRIDNTTHIVVNTRQGAFWRLLNNGINSILPANDKSDVLCELRADLGEFGIYNLVVDPSSDNGLYDDCNLHTVKDPVNIYFPLLIWFFILAGLWIFFYGINMTWKYVKYNFKASSIPKDLELTNEPSGKKKGVTATRQRLSSLDTFRGISIVIMIFVNHGGGSYWFMEHATWNGLHVADLVFPWFMWIMGVCIPISVRSQLRKNLKKLKILRGILRRSCLLFILGLCVNTVAGYSLDNLRIFGVLQRFGLVYFIVASLNTLCLQRNYEKDIISWLVPIKDIVALFLQWMVVIVLTAIHLFIIFFVEVPGCPTGYLGPGGIQYEGQYKDCVGGATGYIDRNALGANHIYQYPTASEIYKSGPFDPEGLIGCLPSILQVFLGVQAGIILGLYKEHKERLLRWLIWSGVTGSIGAVLCLVSKEDGWIPVNKNLWSLSFVMVTSCFAFFLLSTLYYVIDVRHWWSGAPFLYPGMNATIMYVGHEVCYGMFPWHWSSGSMNTHMLRLSQDIWGTLGWIIVAYWLHSNKFFLSL